MILKMTLIQLNGDTNTNTTLFKNKMNNLSFKYYLNGKNFMLGRKI